jgi:hypothetical protein
MSADGAVAQFAKLRYTLDALGELPLRYARQMSLGKCDAWNVAGKNPGDILHNYIKEKSWNTFWRFLI